MVEIIPKKPEKEIPLKNISLFIAGALLLAAIFGYVILLRLEAGGLSAIQDLEAAISGVGDKEDKEIEENVFKFESKIADFKTLWSSRQKSSNFFDNFGKLVHPRVWFSSLDFDLIEMRSSVSGRAADFKALEQQLIFLQSKNDVAETFELSGVKLGKEGEVDFNLALDFTPKIFEDSEK